MKNFISTYKFDIILVVLFLSLCIWIANSFSFLLISGSSMSPTYEDGNILILKQEKTLKENQIVIFEPPENWNNNNGKYIKRVIGKPGDTIKIENGILIVNGKTKINAKMRECNISNKNIKVPEDSFFAMGDNHAVSNDSYAHFCKGEKNFFVPKEKINVLGKEFKKFGGINK